MSENEIRAVSYEKNNQKVLANGGVCIYFGNVFDQTVTGKLPMIKLKLRKILVDFGFCQTALEINQSLNFIRIFYRDESARELKGTFLQRFNDFNKESQAIEVSISLEGSSCSPPKTSREVKTYSGLTKLIYQEFIQSIESKSMIDLNPLNEMKEIIRKGNLAACVPLESIFRGELG